MQPQPHAQPQSQSHTTQQQTRSRPSQATQPRTKQEPRVKQEERQAKRRRSDAQSQNTARMSIDSRASIPEGVEVNNSQDTTVDPQEHTHSGELDYMSQGYEKDLESFAPDNMPDLIQSAGQMLMVGLSGSKVTDAIRKLITDYRVGSIILSSKNMKSMLFHHESS